MIFRHVVVMLMLAGVTACGQQAGSTTSETVTTPTSAGTANSSPAPAYAATKLVVNETRGSNTVDVTLPQVSGGTPAVRDRFNSGMHAALEDLLGPAVDTAIYDGSLLDGDSSRITTLGPNVVGGVAIFNWYAQGAAHPNNSVATIVIDARTAKPILLKDVWTDPQAAAAKLSTLVVRIDDRIGPLDPATMDNVLDWLPTPEGFHVYVPVAHVLGDYLPVTVPWAEIAELMTPAMRAALVG